jgi:hypothetical protein
MPRRSLVLFLLLSIPLALRGEDSLVPQAGLLVLRNGQILEGEITRAGDYYVVTLGATGEIRLPAAEVEGRFGSMDDAYRAKRDALPDRGADPHLDLAEWCLRHNLKRHCAEQLIAAMRKEPAHPKIRELEQRLTLSAQGPPPASAKLPTTSATVGAEQLEETIRSLPSASVEKFSGVVQPLLLNRCGAGQCHGPNSKAQLRLLKPPAGQVASQRFTQRNLYAVLQQIDQAHPEASPLLVMPQRRHGTALSAVFDKHNQKQLEELTAWVKGTFPTRTVAQPASIGSARPATLSQPAPANTSGQSPAPAAAEEDEQYPGEGETSRRIEAKRPDLSSPVAGGPAAVFVPRDPYDAEIFNRRFEKPADR